MERAGAGLARLVAAGAGRGPVRVVVGKGNNGGDGLVVARLLREEGREVDVLAVADLGELRATRRRTSSGCPATRREPFAPEALEGSGAVVDAMLGTGFEGAPREPIAGRHRGDQRPGRPGDRLRRALGRQRLHRARSRARRCAPTATGDLPRREGRACTSTPARSHAGEVEVIEIGIPRGAPERRARRPDRRPRCSTCTRRRGREGTKFASGVVVVAGRPEGLTGAPTMAALSAQRAGAGYVQVAVPEPAAAGDRAAAAGGHEPRAARPRRRPHAGGRRGRGGDGRARGRGGAGPGPGPRGGRRRVRPRGRRGGSRCRC